MLGRRTTFEKENLILSMRCNEKQRNDSREGDILYTSWDRSKKGARAKVRPYPLEEVPTLLCRSQGSL